MIANIFTQGSRPLFVAMLLMLVSMASQAQVPQAAAQTRDETVVTLYSESRPTAGTLRTEDKPDRPPIQIIDGGVKSAGPSCWDMDESGQIVPVAGECYVLRSAAPGEKPPVRK